MRNNEQVKEVKETKLTSTRDYMVHVYTYEGGTFNLTKKLSNVQVERVTCIKETEDTIMFCHYNDPVGVFYKDNVVSYVAM